MPVADERKIYAHASWLGPLKVETIIKTHGKKLRIIFSSFLSCGWSGSQHPSTSRQVGSRQVKREDKKADEGVISKCWDMQAHHITFTMCKINSIYIFLGGG